MSNVIDIKTRKDVTPPPTLTQRLHKAVVQRPNTRYCRDELAVSLARIGQAAYEVTQSDQYDPAVRSFCGHLLNEVMAVIIKLETP